MDAEIGCRSRDAHRLIRVGQIGFRFPACDDCSSSEAGHAGLNRTLAASDPKITQPMSGDYFASGNA